MQSHFRFTYRPTCRDSLRLVKQEKDDRKAGESVAQ